MILFIRMFQLLSDRLMQFPLRDPLKPFQDLLLPILGRSSHMHFSHSLPPRGSVCPCATAVDCDVCLCSECAVVPNLSIVVDLGFP
jgi:hypothetical protein